MAIGTVLFDGTAAAAAVHGTLRSQGGNVVEGTKRVRRGTFQLSAAYPANGEAYTVAQLGLSKLHRLQLPEPTFVKGSVMYSATVDAVNSKIKVFQHSTHAEAAGTPDLSGVNIPFEAHGV